MVNKKAITLDNTDSIEPNPLVGIMVLGAVGLLILTGFVHVVNYGERGILTTFGAVDPVPKGEGIYLKIPFMQSYHNMDIKVQKMEDVADSASKDLQSLDTTIALNYHLDADKAAEIYQTIGNIRMVEQKVISPAIQEACKAGTAQYTAEELITKRPLVKESIKTFLRERLSHYGIVLDDFSIINFQFSAEFDNAIEHKVTAEQNALKAQWELEQFRIEQQKQIEEAKAYSTAITTKAQADANATIISAKADAEAFKLRNDQLTPILIEYFEINQWDGELPSFLGTGAIPFVDLDGSS